MSDSKRLALDGGKPVRASVLPYGHQSIGEDDVSAVIEVLRSDWLTSGPKVAEFEEAFSCYVGADYAVCFSSGTAALHATIFAAEMGIEAEAITTPLSFCATANCLVYQGGTPVFADVCRDTLNIDPLQVKTRITGRTKGIIAVDYAGHPADLDELTELAHHNELTLIEDASHALGAEYKGRKVGGDGHMTVFSFHPVKHITTGEGGMVTTNDQRLAKRLRIFRNHGIDRDARARQATGDWYYEMVALGYNYRLNEVGCALGLSQLCKLDSFVKRRREIAARYESAFRGQTRLNIPATREKVNPSWHLYPIQLNLEALSASRAQVFRALRAEGIGVNVHYIPIHLHPFYRERYGYKGCEFPVAEAAYERLITLPLFHGMNDQDVQDVVMAVSKVLGFYAAN